MLADTLTCTDRSRLRPCLYHPHGHPAPDLPPLQRLSSPTGLRWPNQRAHLRVVFPGVSLFADLDSRRSLYRFLPCFLTARTARICAGRRPPGWAAVGYCGRPRLACLVPRVAPSARRGANSTVTWAMVAALTSVATQTRRSTRRSPNSFARRDAHIFHLSAPPGTVRAAWLLAEIADAAGPFPHA